MKRETTKTAVTGDIYEVYRELCNILNLEPLTQRRVSGLVNELDTIGILNTKVVSLGRYGRTKKIEISVPRSLVRGVYSEDNWVGKLIEYKPRCFADK